ncbi:hypothetical protein AU476_18170 [Cupriavidus sp. UYMSc13B]|nr:hypothetical protein AU476_18170 [Cupriavidus sp. UYMSc13B]
MTYEPLLSAIVEQVRNSTCADNAVAQYAAEDRVQLSDPLQTAAKLALAGVVVLFLRIDMVGPEI